MKKYLAITLAIFLFGCDDERSYNIGGEKMEEIYSGGNSNLNTHIYKIKIDSIVYIVAYRRDGISIIKHGEVHDTK